MAYAFNNPGTEKEIDTFEQLDESGLPIVSSSYSIKNLFSHDDDDRPLYRSLQAKFVKVDNVTAINLAAYERSACALERFTDVKILIKVCSVLGISFEFGSGNNAAYPM